MRKFFGLFVLGLISVIGGCDLQPKISSIPDSVGDFISERYPTLLAEPDSEIYKTAVADYGVYASPTVYGNGDMTADDYVLYSSTDDYMMPAQDTEIDESDVGMPDSDEEVAEVDTTEEDDSGYEPDDEIEDLRIPDYVNEVPVLKVNEKPKIEIQDDNKDSVQKVEQQKIEPKSEKKATPKPEVKKQVVQKTTKTEPVSESKVESGTQKTPEMVRAVVREITVEKGDTLYSISRKYSVPVNDLAVMNKMSAPFALSVGQKVKVPDVLSVSKPVAKSERVAVVKQESVKKDSDKEKTVENNKPVQNIVKPEQKTVQVKPKTTDVKKTGAVEKQKTDNKVQQSVAKTTVKENKTKPVDVKKSNTKTTVNNKSDTPKKSVVKKTESKKTNTTNKTTKSTQKTAQKPKTETKKTPAKQLAARSSSKFSWPVRGRILSGYGAKTNGLFNDGINIKAARGTTVVAAENGIVAYAGNEVKGMGNLVIIQHSDGWMTVYAHMDSMNVRRGSTVMVGQKIGTVGTSGKVDQAQLHFEIRKGTKAYNPISYLKK